MSFGHDVEEYVRRLAAGLGVPDFVYLPATIAKGRARREVSDGLLVAGDRGLILQVKSRDPAARERDDKVKATSWLESEDRKAFAQVGGTRRTLERSTVMFESMRGYERVLQPKQPWPGVILLDHPLADGVSLPTRPNVLHLTLLDWWALHDRIRSTAGVIEYVLRALELEGEVALGHEHHRYLALATADAEWADGPGRVPLLPLDPLSHDERVAVAVFDDLVDKVADRTNRFLGGTDYLDVVELLDGQPVLVRATIGEKMVRTLNEVRAAGKPQGFLGG